MSALGHEPRFAGKGMASAGRPIMGRDDWLTPPELLRALGTFDLDPCSPVVRPWDTAAVHFSVYDNGLVRDWHGRVWLNPPYGRETIHWLARLHSHGNGIALVFARTETAAWFKHVWGVATGVLFLRGRLDFYDVRGRKALYNAGAPSALVAYGQRNVDALKRSRIEGRLVQP